MWISQIYNEDLILQPGSTLTEQIDLMWHKTAEVVLSKTILLSAEVTYVYNNQPYHVQVDAANSTTKQTVMERAMYNGAPVSVFEDE